MRKYLLIDMYAHKNVMTSPKIKTEAMTISYVFGVIISMS